VPLQCFSIETACALLIGLLSSGGSRPIADSLLIFFYQLIVSASRFTNKCQIPGRCRTFRGDLTVPFLSPFCRFLQYVESESQFIIALFSENMELRVGGECFCVFCYRLF
jgi:hypothetical protein